VKIRAGKDFWRDEGVAPRTRDKDNHHNCAGNSHLKALRSWGSNRPASTFQGSSARACRHGDSDRMVQQ